MKLVVYGLTITSSWGNGHATTYRSLLKALARRGHQIEFVEKEVEWYRSNRDLPEPEFCGVTLYSDWNAERGRLLALARDADVVVVGSYFPDAIAATQALLDQGRCPVFFYDIDTPITLAGLRERGRTEYLEASAIAGYAGYLSFTGGPALVELEREFSARRAVALYCSVDPDLYQPVPQRREFTCDLSYLGTYAADRQAKLLGLLDGAAGLLPEQRFLVAGPQYPEDCRWQPNVRSMRHVSPVDHPAFYSSGRFALNLTRQEMVAAGYSPSVRLFEAGACGAAIVSDEWVGLSEFLTPGEEILLARSGAEMAAILTEVSERERQQMGSRARARILAEHTSEHRARQFESVVGDASVAT